MSQKKIIFGQHKKYGLFIEIILNFFFFETTLSHNKLNKRN